MNLETLDTLDVRLIWLHIGETGKHFCRLCFFLSFSGWNLIFDQKIVNWLHFWGFIYIFLITELKYYFRLKNLLRLILGQIQLNIPNFWSKAPSRAKKSKFEVIFFDISALKSSLRGISFFIICNHPDFLFWCNNTLFEGV